MDPWQKAIHDLDPETQQLLQPPGGSVNHSVVTLIDDIKNMKTTRDASGWTITIPGTDGDKPINLRRTVYSVMEAAFEFNDIVTQVLQFDPTKYGNFLV